MRAPKYQNQKIKTNLPCNDWQVFRNFLSIIIRVATVCISSRLKQRTKTLNEIFDELFISSIRPAFGVMEMIVQ